MDNQDLDLLDLIYGMVERLMLTTDFNESAIVATLEPIVAELEAMAETYQPPAPEGAETLQELLLRSVERYRESLGEILDFLEDQDEDRLRRAVLMAEEACDVLSAVEYLIQTNKDILSQYVEA